MKKTIKSIAICIVVLLILVFALTYLPHKLVSIEPARVSKITIFNGNTGEETEIIDSSRIDYIITNLNDVTFQKSKPSFGWMGFSFRTTFFDNRGNKIKELIINSSDTIRYNGFFYKTKENEIDYKYIEQLVNK